MEGRPQNVGIPHINSEVRRILLSTNPRLADIPLTARALLCIDLLLYEHCSILWIAESVREMEKLHESILTLISDDWRHTVKIFRPQEKDPAVFGEHLRIVEHLSENRPFLILTCAQALENEIPGPANTARAVRSLKTGEYYNLPELTEWMVEAGYEFGVEVYQQGEAALRGGILDCWPPGFPRPVRIEFFGDEIDSIRYFDDQTQCSVGKTTSVKLSPLNFDFAGNETCHLIDLLPAKTLIASPSNSWKFAEKKFRRLETGFIETVGPVSPGFTCYDTGLFAVSLDVSPDEAETARRGFVSDLCKKASQGWNIHFYFETEGTLARFRELYSNIEGFQNLTLHRGVLHDSTIDSQRRILIVAECDFYAYHINRSAHARTAKRFQTRERISEAADIQPGDYVVHFEHGIGKYLGIIEIDFGGRRQEVLAIEYARRAKVYLPVTQAHLLTRYKGMGKTSPKLHRLGSKKWKEDKAEALVAIRDLASTLLEIQAMRKAKKCHRFSKDTPWQAEFEASFPYTETPDQLIATEEIKRDMEKARPMDRLLCGDVGFGKTEVAMRAAFKAVMDGMQVAVLVPTTVLAQQHYDTFIERMAAFPIRIDMVSRFRTRAQQNITLARTRAGEVDILIGTHRLLSRDVTFKNLGLVIIDEEQRFGVRAKEHLKQLRTQVDVITMTATPIPRTLYMSLTGVRDLSIIKTAPQERQPVETIVVPYNEEIVVEAIRRELHRDGQVFYLHNRVKTIRDIEARLRKLIPEARIAAAHGQMNEKELSEIMHIFVEGRIDVLLCTTIIENGVDIPNCNTIIIENAERFGLSELYQLRGRVGRSNQKAFAYLMISAGGETLYAVRDRMAAIKRYSGLGSGFRLALRDLELRGAGNLLGARQSGHISAIGFDLYCQLLKRTIAMMKGQKPPPLMDVTINIDFLNLSPMSQTDSSDNGAYIPYYYVEDENLRLRLYQRISILSTKREIMLMKREMKDRFGKLPKEVQRLFLLSELRIVAAEKGLKQVIVNNSRVMLCRGKNDYVQTGGRHPRLEQTRPDARLKELIELVKTL